ncbi:MAG: fused MFS/spermidine synthase [Fimbriiglobus sp.]
MADSNWARLVVVGAIVFAANAGLLVLQLVGGKLLSPFVGSSLETWTLLIGAFLTGIALGNAVGGRYSAILATPRGVAGILVAGALSALWMVGLPELLQATGSHQSLPLTVRIPVLSFALCLPAGFTLSLLTPAAVRLGIPDVQKTGRIAGIIFALSSLGCLLGNYVTGFQLIPNFSINMIVFVVAGLLVLLAFLSYRYIQPLHAINSVVAVSSTQETKEELLGIRAGACIVFCCSLAGMTLELTASRLLAQVVGVSIYTWTGIIGVMLAGTACGNWLGGQIAAPGYRGRLRLTWSLLFAAITTVMIMISYIVITQNKSWSDQLDKIPLISRILTWTFALFFAPMLGLGLISPQVIRLCVGDVSEAGSTAGRIYAWSTAGAIAGTFLTGYFFISQFGMFRTILLASLFPALVTALVLKIHKQGPALYVVSMLIGAAGVGMFRVDDFTPGSITAETNYYTIRVVTDPEQPQYKTLQLDLLIHSTVDITDPRYIRYQHEWTQLDFVFAAKDRHPEQQQVLVIGGGGYTFPRCTASFVPTAKLDVVEIDPGVTRVAYSHLALDTKLPITSFNQDGRQFVEEVAAPKHYDLITLDAVNDLSVPGHLLTKEFNEGVKRIMKPDGVYLVTVIDILESGPLWKSVVKTLQGSYKHVEVLCPSPDVSLVKQDVYCIYAADQPLDLKKLDGQTLAGGGDKRMTYRVDPVETSRLLNQPAVVLRDQFAPVDNMMSGVFRNRNQ